MGGTARTPCLTGPLPGAVYRAGMLDDLLALLDKPLLLLIVLAIGGVIGIMLESTLNRIDREKRRAYWAGRKAAGKRGKESALQTVRRLEAERDAKLSLAAEQLKLVMKADFRPRALLNRREVEVFRALERIVTARNPGWQVMAQVSLGEFLGSEDKDAYSCINSKRVDFALMDPDGRVHHALEYQGAGHHQGSAAACDAVKKEALRKAGIGYHEIVAGHTTPADLRALVERLVPAGGARGKAA